MLIINKIFLWRSLLAVLIILTLLFIWSNSLADATESTDLSDSVIEKVKPIIDPEDRISADIFEKIVRKTAHFSEFLILGIEMYLFLSTFEKWKRLALITALPSVGISFICAVTDELLQLTSEGRACSFADMMIDLSGIAAGTLVIAAIRFAAERIRAAIKHTV